LNVGKLDGRVALITGGASGIGEATVRLFVAEGARVVVADLQDAKGQALANELGASAAYQRTDVTQDADVRAAVERATREFGRLDCIYNNAGITGAVGQIDAIAPEEFDTTMAVDLRGVFLGMRHAAPIMKAQGSGSIISTASIAGLRAGEGPHVYSAAKAAVIHLTRSVALELAPHSVRVNCICPGAIVTPMVTMGALEPTKEALEAMKPMFSRFQPIPRAGMPDDIARAALWLASDDSSFVTGHALVVDGARTAGVPWDQQPETFKVRR
jgi:NAD(P)-dependent dehydrogenase (short-subunit alcohol dehydrogenase family)